ncbi:hypothetical protein N7491_005095 [Penicillium cf. griseofulvum]|uniref:Uncharacterized protein n=1 Tax=Penicillium cf. griseofulvum TaxID=2972120 RepID=A0A9W9J183_9EURO|nr:hypothetical protein N7472_007788 [Penicillium cf. griseofulvum]KAJ5434500.1 hypothetical protein N7491_005095 [Penicillium cf. griseofulvum]KAJ5452330.1 hypothetical protein N7445_000513 [Penicillium cf. griseofulvum]
MFTIEQVLGNPSPISIFFAPFLASDFDEKLGEQLELWRRRTRAKLVTRAYCGYFTRVSSLGANMLILQTGARFTSWVPEPLFFKYAFS